MKKQITIYGLWYTVLFLAQLCYIAHVQEHTISPLLITYAYAMYYSYPLYHLLYLGSLIEIIHIIENSIFGISGLILYCLTSLFYHYKDFFYNNLIPAILCIVLYRLLCHIGVCMIFSQTISCLNLVKTTILETIIFYTATYIKK